MPGAAIFADIIKIVTMFIKTIIKDSRKIKRILETMYQIQSTSVCLDIAKFADFR